MPMRGKQMAALPNSRYGAKTIEHRDIEILASTSP